MEVALQRSLRRFAAALAIVLATALAAVEGADAAVTTSFDATTGSLSATSDGASDSIVVHCVSGFAAVNGQLVTVGQFTVPCDGVRRVDIAAGDGNDVIDTLGVSAPTGFTSLPANEGDRDAIVVFGGSGDDLFADGPSFSTFDGSPGRDVAFGGDGADMLIGNQSALAGGGGDPSGRDRLYGQGDSDVLHGGVRADTILGGLGRDTILGNEGDDEISGGAGFDRIGGGDDDDDISGGGGGDDMFGNDGDDEINGSGDRDDADGGRGRDRCRAERVRHCESEKK